MSLFTFFPTSDSTFITSAQYQYGIYVSNTLRLLLHIHHFSTCDDGHIIVFFFFFFPPMMYIIDIVKRGSAYKHLLLLLPFQSDNENVVKCLL